MKRSEVNQIIRKADAFIKEHHFHLPPFAYWSPQEWTRKGKEVMEIAQNHLGWDITDFGTGDFSNHGLVLFTIRNGAPENWQRKEGKLYAEKLLIVGVNQITPMHFHWTKMEDIINRGGGNLAIQLFNSSSEEGLDPGKPVRVQVDAAWRDVEPGGVVILEPGESITLTPYLYHKFWGEGSQVLVGEVSLVNDDNADNRFQQPLPRFPAIEEDEEPLYLLVNDYERYYQFAVK
jgi:D-lyxose ketol-isomerase